jgi:hypothetical protein
METKNKRFIKSLMLGVLWFGMQVPTDWVLWRCEAAEIVVALPYAIAAQGMTTVIAIYLVYQVLQHAINRPYKCPACDGHGRRLIFGSDPHSEVAKTAGKCFACKGTGLVWEKEEACL